MSGQAKAGIIDKSNICNKCLPYQKTNKDTNSNRDTDANLN